MLCRDWQGSPSHCISRQARQDLTGQGTPGPGRTWTATLRIGETRQVRLDEARLGMLLHRWTRPCKAGTTRFGQAGLCSDQHGRQGVTRRGVARSGPTQQGRYGWHGKASWGMIRCCSSWRALSGSGQGWKDKAGVTGPGGVWGARSGQSWKDMDWIGRSGVAKSDGVRHDLARRGEICQGRLGAASSDMSG